VGNSDASPPADYQPPILVWLVEFTDSRQPGWRFQVGAFTTEAEAQKLLTRLRETGSYADLLLNMVAVHRTIRDWEWDR
jgi:cell division septation protein DedD